MSESVGSFIDETVFNKMVEDEVRRLIRSYMAALTHRLVADLNATVTWAYGQLGVPFKIETHLGRMEDGFEIYARIYLDAETKARIREVVARELRRGLEDRRMRLKILKQILAGELSSNSGGVGALLPGVRAGAGKGDKEAGGGGAEIRRQERGSTGQGAGEGVDRGGEVA